MRRQGLVNVKGRSDRVDRLPGLAVEAIADLADGVLVTIERHHHYALGDTRFCTR
jgi:hypothetical protein